MNLPKVSILVASQAPGHSLSECLSSLQAQTYPKERVTITVNGATEQCDGEYVALVSDEVLPDPEWLRALVTKAEQRQAAAVAATIFESDRRTVHFAGRGLEFLGFPSLPASGTVSGDRVLYASRASCLVRRSALTEAGGFDHGFLQCLDDVDLGWRLNVLGHAVVPAWEARAYRVPSVAAPGNSSATRQRLEERNALAMIFKNYEDRTLERVLPAAVALSLMRGLLESGIDTLTLELASSPAERVDVSPRLIAHLIALEDFSRALPALRRQREYVQQARRRSDADILPLFGDALRLEGSAPYQALARTLIADLAIDEIFDPGRMDARGVASGAVGSSSVASGFSRTPPIDAKVSVIILTALGPMHLAECLGALRQQTYPHDRIEVIVVDNGSAEDPTPEALRAYPGARVIRNGKNLGFAAGNNVGAAAATGEYVVFLNDDTRAEPRWLQELLDTAARRGAAAVASFIVDWTGTRVDFVEGAVNFQGKGFQLHYDAPAESLALKEKSLLFACGCSVLVDRRVFLDAGGWDEGTFAYYEDVELGWRLNLLGHGVWFSPASVVHHKHHGTSGRWPEPPRLRLYERNSLRMLYALLDAGSLRRVLPAALLLSADRALLGTSFSRTHDATIRRKTPLARLISPRWLLMATKHALVNRGVSRQMSVIDALRRVGVRGSWGVVREVLGPRRPEPTLRRDYAMAPDAAPGHPRSRETLPMAAGAALAGIFAFLSDIPELSERRARIQARRCLSDPDMVAKFGSHWLHGCPAPFQAEHDEFQSTLIEQFRLAEER